MERHESKEARVIPILLRPVDDVGVPFEGLLALPGNSKPITMCRIMTKPGSRSSQASVEPRVAWGHSEPTS